MGRQTVAVATLRERRAIARMTLRGGGPVPLPAGLADCAGIVNGVRVRLLWRRRR